MTSGNWSNGIHWASSNAGNSNSWPPTYGPSNSCRHLNRHHTVNGERCADCGHTFTPTEFFDGPETVPPPCGEVLTLVQDDDDESWFLPGQYVWERRPSPPTEVVYPEPGNQAPRD